MIGEACMFDRKVVAITGAGSGIRQALAVQFATKGARRLDRRDMGCIDN
jgi:NAD(P)-dependent dehydrogenase (short-subunit alcohol dehydrogenase family)